MNEHETHRKTERVARAIYEREIADVSIPDELKWDDLAIWQKEEFFGMARAAIDALSSGESDKLTDGTTKMDIVDRLIIERDIGCATRQAREAMIDAANEIKRLRKIGS